MSRPYGASAEMVYQSPSSFTEAQGSRDILKRGYIYIQTQIQIYTLHDMPTNLISLSYYKHYAKQCSSIYGNIEIFAYHLFAYYLFEISSEHRQVHNPYIIMMLFVVSSQKYIPVYISPRIVRVSYKGQTSFCSDK